jgi:hypothetical protein
METTFDKVPVYGVFTTGPSSVLFVKLSDQHLKNTPGQFNAIDLNGKVGRYIPGSRVVQLMDENDKLVVWAG